MKKKEEFLSEIVEGTIRIAFLAGLAIWCFMIFRPFAIITIWGIILAVGLYPLFRKFEKLFGGRKKIAATVVTLIIIAILFIPSYFLTDSFIGSGKKIVSGFMQGQIIVPRPPLSVYDWPFVGQTIYKMWDLSHTNLADAISKLGPQLKPVGGFILKVFADAGVSIFQFIIAVIIAGFIFVYGDHGAETAQKICIRIFGDKGKEFADLSGATIRSVAQGILGIAFIQAVLAGAGFIFIQMPGAALWTILVLIMAVVQVPLLIALIPLAIYAFTYTSTTMAVIFLIWCLLVSATDPILKPLLLGRGVKIPMAVILIGAIGGLFLSGLIGLFVGAVIFSLGYKTYQWWLYGEIVEV
jgi:predicted PurR-regulated permease PerM